MNVNNRRVDKKDLTFFQWLNIYEGICKKEFKEMESYKQDLFKTMYENFKKGCE